jgi:hypothetical protein
MEIAVPIIQQETLVTDDDCDFSRVEDARYDISMKYAGQHLIAYFEVFVAFKLGIKLNLCFFVYKI